MPIYDAAQEYIKNNIDTVIIAGKEFILVFEDKIALLQRLFLEHL